MFSQLRELVRGPPAAGRFVALISGRSVRALLLSGQLGHAEDFSGSLRHGCKNPVRGDSRLHVYINVSVALRTLSAEIMHGSAPSVRDPDSYAPPTHPRCRPFGSRQHNPCATTTYRVARRQRSLSSRSTFPPDASTRRRSLICPDPEHFRFEIGENVTIQNIERAERLIRSLRRLGCWWGWTILGQACRLLRICDSCP